MGKFIDLTGQTFGRWRVLGRGENRGNEITWICKCACPKGTIREVSGNSLRRGVSKSCGCLHDELLVERCTKHGYAKQHDVDRLYQIYCGMKERCYNPKSQYFYLYGGRGIGICAEWLERENGSVNFIEWSRANGYRDNLTIDRINSDGNYEPSNCRWVTTKEQNNNRRNNRYIHYNGECRTITEWAEVKELTYSALAHRLTRGGL